MHTFRAACDCSCCMFGCAEPPQRSSRLYARVVNPLYQYLTAFSKAPVSSRCVFEEVGNASGLDLQADHTLLR